MPARAYATDSTPPAPARDLNVYKRDTEASAPLISDLFSLLLRAPTAKRKISAKQGAPRIPTQIKTVGAGNAFVVCGNSRTGTEPRLCIVLYSRAYGREGGEIANNVF